ncbi:MAG TPA: amidohydrolase family protein [Patescibacteria group bacterium]|nr:amidohydrolase family protein [Patescibacteria group bacterium]
MTEQLYKKIKEALRANREEYIESESHSRYKINNPKYKTVLIHNAPYIITCDDTNKLRCLEKQSIVIENGIIKSVMPAEKITKKDFDLVYDAGKRGGVVITPGFINAHSHPPMYLMRSAMMLDEGESIDKTISAFPSWERSMTDEDYTFSAIGDITEQQKSGITSTLSHFSSYNPLEYATRSTKHNLINALSVASSVHPENSPELIKKVLQNNDGDRSKLAVCLHYLHKASPSVLKEVKKLIEEHGLIFTTHMAESKEVVDKCIKKHGGTEVETLEKYGLLNNRTIVSHSIYVSESDIKKMVKNNVGIVHLPTSNVIHKSGTFPLWKFFDIGGQDQVALGTDGVVSKNRLDLLSEAYQTRVTHQYVRTIKFGALFKMMTVNGARILNMHDRGKVVPGMFADLSFWKIRDRGFVPYDEKNPMTLLGNLITHGGRSVRDLMIDGKFIIKNRRHQYVNESKLLSMIQKSHMNMRKRREEKNG